MPKVLVLFDSADSNADQLAELAATGAKSVRFTEVDVRIVANESATDSRRQRLESPDAVDQYDGVIIIGSDREIAPGIESLLAEVDRAARGEFVDRVLAAVPPASPTARRLSSVGGIVVGVRAGSMDLETAARKTGERVAKVVEWVRHALSHEHGHGHSTRDHAKHTH